LAQPGREPVIRQWPDSVNTSSSPSVRADTCAALVSGLADIAATIDI
jgi:hypothetical protein